MNLVEYYKKRDFVRTERSSIRIYPGSLKFCGERPYGLVSRKLEFWSASTLPLRHPITVTVAPTTVHGMIELFGHATYLLLAMSYLVRDVVWLRALAIPASLCSIVFSYFAPAQPLWLIINWNLLFLFVNAIQLSLTFHANRAIKMSDEVANFATLVSPSLSATQAGMLFQRGVREQRVGPADLILEGRGDGPLLFVLDGTVTITQDNEPIGNCGRGSFLGEISFLTNDVSSASVTLGDGEVATIIRWDQAMLKSFAKSRPEFHIAVQQCLASNLSRKFMRRENRRRENKTSIALPYVSSLF